MIRNVETFVNKMIHAVKYKTKLAISKYVVSGIYALPCYAVSEIIYKEIILALIYVYIYSTCICSLSILG